MTATTLAPSSWVISVATLMTREISQIAKTATVEMIATIQKATMIHEQHRTVPDLTDEYG